MRSFKISVVKVLTLLVAMLMLGTSTFAQVSVTLPNISGVVGTTGTGAITVGDLTGKNVTAFSFTLYYDKSVMEITGATPGSLLGDNAPTVNADIANGKISVAWASATALTGSGTLVNLQIAYKAGGSSALNFGSPSTFKFNAGNPAATVTDGSATVPAIILQGGTISVRAGDVVKIPVTVSAITDAQNVRSYNFVASYDKNVINITNVDVVSTLSADGNIAVNPNNTTGSASVAWASANRIITTGGTLVYLTGTAIAPGTTTVAFSAVNVNAGSPLASGNAGTVTVAAANVAPTLTLNPVGPTFSITDGTAFSITLTGADGNPEDVATLVYTATGLPTGATFVNKVFSWTPTLAQRSATPYSVTFKVADSGGLSASVTVTITVAQNVAPTLTLSPSGAQTVSENQKLTITLVGADANPSDVAGLKYTLQAPSATGAAVSGNVFTWTPTYDQGQVAPYVFTFVVTDQAGLTGNATVSVKVNDVQRPPVFTTELPYTVVPVVKVAPQWSNPGPKPFTFTYVANSPEGRVLNFSLIAGPAGAQITADGVFSWLPVEAQKGLVYTVTVLVSDGILTATSTQLIAASSIVTGVDDGKGVPTEYSLFQNYPNPFNPSTSIQIALPKEGNVKLTVYNILGEEVAVLANKYMSAGYHKFNFDASKLNSGMYLYKVEANDFVSVKKMLLVK
jgi:hypothetical protein